MKNIAIVSTAGLTDRMFCYSTFLDYKFEDDTSIIFYSISFNDEERKSIWKSFPYKIIGIDNKIPEQKFFPFTFFRKVNDRVQDNRLKLKSRVNNVDFIKNKDNLNFKDSFVSHLMNVLVFLITIFGLHNFFESFLDKTLTKESRSKFIYDSLLENKISHLVVTSPYWVYDPLFVNEAKKLGVKVMCLIPSWDNLSTKPRLGYIFDAFLVWSKEQKRQLNEYYSYTKNINVEIVGAPQYDIFYSDRYKITRQEYCKEYDFDENKPIILYALGSPNFIDETNGVIDFLNLIKNDYRFDHFQFIIRMHPIHDNGIDFQSIGEFKFKLVIQRNKPNINRYEAAVFDDSKMSEWINTFLHSDVTIQLCSTVAVDASIFSKPVINLVFDPSASKVNDSLVHDIAYNWVHFPGVTKLKVLKEVKGIEDLPNELLNTLKEGVKESESQKVVNFVIGYNDGKSGLRLADSIQKFANQ